MSNLQPKLSVITVVYNNVHDIERTLLSVLNQTYPNIEYLVIDGLSNDGTLDIINQYKVTKLISEKDQGIYDAMNKGLAIATGDYVLFMNSGDEIYAADTVAKYSLSNPMRIFTTAKPRSSTAMVKAWASAATKLPKNLPGAVLTWV